MFLDRSVGSRAQSRSGTSCVALETISRIDFSEFLAFEVPLEGVAAVARPPSPNSSLRFFRFRIAMLRFLAHSTILEWLSLQKQITYIIFLTTCTNMITCPSHVGAVPCPGTRIGRPLDRSSKLIRLDPLKLLPFL